MTCSHVRTALALFAFTGLLATAGALPAAAVCLQPPGDLTGDGITNVVDVQCSTLATLWSISGGSVPFPACVPNGNTTLVDSSCDNKISVVDVQLLIAYSLHLPLDVSIDANGDNCPDACGTAVGALSVGSLVITEIMVNPKLVSDGIGEWFEVRNVTNQALPISGLTIRDDGSDSHVVVSPALVQPGDVFVFGRNTDTAVNGGAAVDYAYSGVQFSNSEDELVLEFQGVEIDRVAYVASGFPQSVGVAMALDPNYGTAANNDDPAYWCAATDAYGLGDFGTPGQVNPACWECGNGVLEIGEDCDDGAANSDVEIDACRTDCQAPSCGDGACDSAENCGTCEVDCGTCGPALCGASRCRADQECVANQCRFPCEGSQVPGDYSTIQAAVSALSPIGGTICVAPGTYNESLTVSPSKALSIVGASADATILLGGVTMGYASGTGAVQLKGMAVQSGVYINDTSVSHPITLTALRVTSASSSAHGVRIRRDNYRPDVTLDGCDVTGGASANAVEILESADFSSASSFQVRVYNCYLHDTAYGISFLESSSANWPTVKLDIRHNTIADTGTAFRSSTSLVYLDLAFKNNVVLESEVGVSVQSDSYVTTAYGGNAYFGNGANFAGDAYAVATDRTDDPKVSWLSTPPEPSAASYLIGSADSAGATPHDYWAEPRDQTPDRGAVERLCTAPPCVTEGAPSCGDGACTGGETCQTCASDCGSCDPGLCAGSCDVDQDCVGGVCQFDCEGARVPGDYASIQAAINALGPVGGTICVAPGTYAESLNVAPKSALSIVGAGAESVTVTGALAFGYASGSGAIVVRGMAIQGGVQVNDTSVSHAIEMDALRISTQSTGGSAHGVRIRRDNYRPNVTLRRCDVVGGTGGAAVSVQESSDFSSASTFFVTFDSCYLHDSKAGIELVESSSANWPSIDMYVHQCTLADNETAFAVTTSLVYLDLDYRGNLITENEVGVNLDVDSYAAITHGNNAFGSNGTHLAGDAYAQASDILTSSSALALNWVTSPPSPTATSVLIGASATDFAGSEDFVGATRDAMPDIGAREFLCANPPCTAAGPSCGDGQCQLSETCQTCAQDCGSCAPGPCGGSCAADQDCVGGVCTFACTGAQVPGDYASIQAAVNALSPVGGTICVQPGSYAGNLSISPTKALSVIGAGAASVEVLGSIAFGYASGSGDVLVQGLAVRQGLQINDTSISHPITLRALVVQSAPGASADAISVRRDNYRPVVIIERCDVAGGADGAAIRWIESADFSSASSMGLTVRSSYLHDSGWGFRFQESSAANWPSAALVFENNTVLDNASAGFYAATSLVYLDASVQNNVFAGGDLGVHLQVDSYADIDMSHNAWHDNATNFDGTAYPDASDVFSDVDFDFATSPPGPGGASPLVSAGAASAAGKLDFFGRPRDAQPDIGAVEKACASPPCSSNPPGCGDGQCGSDEDCAVCPSDCGACNTGGCAAKCYADQQCIAGQCVFPCDGVRVPGDYSSIGSAAQALGPVGGTICVAPGTYTSGVNYTATKNLAVIGTGPEQVTIASGVQFSYASGSGQWLLRGVTVQGGVTVSDTSVSHAVTLDAVRVTNTGGSASHGVHIRRDNYRPHVVVSRADIAGDFGADAVRITESADFSSASSISVRVENSYLHDSQAGVRILESSAANWPSIYVDIVNNTMLDNEYGISSSTSLVYLDLSYVNNVCAEGYRGVGLTTDSYVTIDHGANAFHGNEANFEGTAVAGPGAVFGDPQFEYLGGVPRPGPTSPLVGAAISGQAPATDYWGKSRDAAPDIGAVER